MTMEYKNDKSEFIAFINAGLEDEGQGSIESCLARVTKRSAKSSSMQGQHYTEQMLEKNLRLRMPSRD